MLRYTESSFLDAIASPSSYPCQWLSEWVSQSVIDSFRFGDSYCISELCELVYFPIWRNSAASAQLMELNVIDATQQNTCNSCTRHNTSSLKYHPLSVKVWKFYKSNHTSVLLACWVLFDDTLKNLCWHRPLLIERQPPCAVKLADTACFSSPTS